MTNGSTTARGRPLLYLIAPLLAVGTLFFAPLATLLRYSVQPAASASGGSGGVTLEHYARFFSDPFYLSSLGLTVATGVLVALLSIAVSYPLAYLFWRSSRRARAWLLVLLLSPFYVNVVVKVFGWMVLLARFGLVNSALVGVGVMTSPSDLLDTYPGLVVVLVHRCVPYMVLLIAGSMEHIDITLLESARVCGSGTSRVFRRVILPLSIPGVLAGGILAFSLTVAAFVIPLLVGGATGRQFVSVLMYQSVSVTQNWNMGAAMGAILLVASIGTIAAASRTLKSSRLGMVISENFGR